MRCARALPPDGGPSSNLHIYIYILMRTRALAKPSGLRLQRLFRRADADPKRAREITSISKPPLSKFERLMRAPHWVRARSSGQFEHPSEAKAGASGQFERPSEAVAAWSGAFERPSEAAAVSSGPSEAERQFGRPSEAKAGPSGQFRAGPSKAEGGSSDPANSKRSRAANLERPSEAKRAGMVDLERPSEAEWARAADSSVPPKPSGLELANVGRCGDFERPSGAEAVSSGSFGTPKGSGAGSSMKANSAARQAPAADSSAPAMPSGVRRAVFERPRATQKSRMSTNAVFSGQAEPS